MKALLVVDIQKGLTKRRGFYNTELFFRTVNAAIEQYSSKGLPIIYIQHINKMLLPNTTEWEIDDRVTMCSNGIVIQKKHGNAFTNTHLDSILKSKNVDEILVCGLSTQHCVKFTCLGGVKNGFCVSILKNGHSNWAKNAAELVNNTENELTSMGVKILELKNNH
ncbi:MAG: isochorismatase family protein [Bacteroidales bacterium]